MTISGGATAGRFRLTTLGGFGLWRHEPELAEGWSNAGLGEKPSALLAWLVWSGSGVPRSVLAETFWEGVEHGRARNSVRQALFRIREILGADAVIEVPQGIVLTRDLDVDLPALLPTERRNGRAGGVSTDALETFGRTRVIRGRAFVTWCALVRGSSSSTRTPTGTPTHLPPRPGQLSPMRSEVARASDASDASDIGTVSPPVTAAVDWLFDLWRRSRDGVPVSAWMPESRSIRRHSVLDQVGSRSVRAGVRMAKVRATGGRRTPFMFERDVASVLWPLPGAVGIEPEHRDAIERISTGREASSGLLQAAILDLITAVAEEMPLLLVLEDPEHYSPAALSDLIALLTARVDCPVLFLVVGKRSARPASPLCFEMPAELHRTEVC